MASTFQPSVRADFQSNVLDLTNSTVNATTTVTSALYLHHNNVSDQDNFEPPFVVSTSLGVHIIAFTVMVSACAVLGTLGNIPVLLVYCAKNERKTSNTFIKVLAVIDLIVCAVIMPYTIILELHLVTSDIVCRVFEFVRHVSISASNLTLVAIAMERYMAVCVISRRLTVHNVNLGMFVVVAVSVVVAIPSMGLFSTVTKKEVENISCAFPHDFDANFSFCHFTTSVLGPGISQAYQTVLMIIFFITFIVIVALYAIVYCSLWKRAKRRSTMQSLRLPLDNFSGSEKRRRPRERPSPSIKQELQESLAGEDDVTLSVGNETSECSSDEQVHRLGTSCELNGWTGKGGQVASRTIARRLVSASFQRHRRTARMLFLCSVVFLITWLPFWVDVFNHTHNLCLRYLFFVGNASNPVVYGVSNANFRRSFLKLFLSIRLPWTLCKHSDLHSSRS